MNTTLDEIVRLGRVAKELGDSVAMPARLDAVEAVMKRITVLAGRLADPNVEDVSQSIAVGVFDLREAMRVRLRELDPDGQLHAVHEDNRDQLIIHWADRG